jgi:hypothetical protein
VERLPEKKIIDLFEICPKEIRGPPKIKQKYLSQAISEIQQCLMYIPQCFSTGVPQHNVVDFFSCA